jgi:SNF2 family DNA or RNA helicase
MENDFVVGLEDGSNLLAPNTLAQLIRLVQLASNPALVGGKDVSAKITALKDMLEYEIGPFIVWVNFIKTAEYLEKYLQDAEYKVAKLTGATKSEDRQTIVDKFQAGQLDVLVANPQVGRFGLTLTAARTVVYLERTHDGDAYYQSLYQVKRIGTKYSPHVIHLIAERKGGGHTVDFVIGKVLEARKDSVLALTSGELKKLFTEGR